MHNVTEMIVTVLTTIALVAIVALVVSKKAQTPQVLQAAWSGFNNGLAVAVSPVTGAVPQPVLQYPAAPGLFGDVGTLQLGFPQVY
jgi:hypothetical protein